MHSMIELEIGNAWFLAPVENIQLLPIQCKQCVDCFHFLFLIKVIKRCYHRYHLLEMLTKINKRIADEQRGNPNGIITVQVPYLTHTLRAKVYLGMNQFMKKYGKSLYVKRRILRVVVELHGRLQ